MQNFRRSVFRLLFFMAFLLFVAWIAMKLMQYRGDWSRLLADGQSWLKGLGIHPEAISKFFSDTVKPKAEEMMQSVRTFFGQP